MPNSISPLRVRGLKAGYGGQTVLNGVDLEVAPGEIRVVLGGSGCGKSTLLRNVTGLEKPWAGTVELLGQSVDLASGRPTDAVLEKVGILFQGGALLSSLSVGDNIALPLRIHHPEIPETLVQEMVRMKLSQVRLEGSERKMPGELSGGMRKRAGLARALVSDPELLFCDEPSAGLDPITSRGLDDLLLELREILGITMVVITHELDSIRTLSDAVTFLSSGTVLFDGTLSDAETRGPQEVRDFLARKPSESHARETPVAFHCED